MAEKHHEGPKTVGTCSEVRVKTEDDRDCMDGHSHQFKVKFNASDRKEYTIHCDQPRTVLEAIKSSKKYNELKCTDENIVIQLGEQDREYAVATHFPCSCLEDGALLIISCKPETVVEVLNKPSEIVQPRNRYSVFYIDTLGGRKTRTKEIFRSPAMKKFKYLCVYGEKGMTVENCLKRDGRFIDDLSEFTLSDNNNPECFTEHTQKVDNLHTKRFKICLPLNKNTKAKDKKQQEVPCASNSSQGKTDSVPVSKVVEVAKQRGTSVKTFLDKSVCSVNSNVNTEEIYEILRQQFPNLKKLMESRFPGDSYEEAVNLRRENFGKIQKSFSEVHRVKKLLELGKSVCKVVVENVRMGTGFVLFDNLILTNAHLFKDCVEGEDLLEGINVFALFNYDDPEPRRNYDCFTVKKTLIDFSDGELDYAVLELNPEGQKPNQSTGTVKVPPGLLKNFGPVPLNGEACIIGHPAGEIKQIDPTCIIERENRGKAVDDHLEPNRDTLFTLHSISQVIINQGIKNIMMGGNEADRVVTYNTFMFHGSSGSPVFDAHCRVFGLHTAGYTYGFKNHTQSVIEFAQPLLTIFKRLLTKIKKSGDEELLKRVEEEAEGNPHLKEDVKVEPEVFDEPMETE
ncbi:serine protease FAM111A-like [Scomber scombrus]|uniref:serine protease FAM111A-like n=1 Tax=Scomber scombrus TaxID=13677 RepID=UPI002DD8A81F|nr:serine protease FAM111A-like [Scomber scombrus]